MKHPRAIGVAACAAAVFALSGGPAFAGEVNGNGEELPLKGASICKYSGLNDEINADEPTRTQSYGTFLQFFGKGAAAAMEVSPGAGIKMVKGMFPSPGVACNPNSDFEE